MANAERTARKALEDEENANISRQDFKKEVLPRSVLIQDAPLSARNTSPATTNQD